MSSMGIPQVSLLKNFFVSPAVMFHTSNLECLVRLAWKKSVIHTV